jgi:outer membrane protein/protease secretion system outer membrane protein
MSMKCHVVFYAVLAGVIHASPVQALDLLGAYRLALTHDANFLAAQSATEATRELVPQAIAGLLPSIGYSKNRSKNSTEQTTETILGPRESAYDYVSLSKQLTLRQPLLRADRVVRLGQAESQVASAEATLEHETQNLALRVSGSYFDVLLANERLNSILAQKKAYAGQLANADRSFVAGEGSRTDIDEARARFLLVSAQEIEASSALFQMEKTLTAVIGKPVKGNELAAVDERKLVFAGDAGKGLDAWLAQAEETNPELKALRHDFEAAQAEVHRNRAQHLPTLDLVASKGYSSSETNTSVGSTYRTDSVGFQLYIPIFSGGQINSTVRQAVANQERVRQEMESARRKLSVEIAKQYDAYYRGSMKVKAYEEARNAARQVLVSVRKGMQAGVRNTVDILNAEQQVATAEVELARSRIEFSLASLRLAAAAGELTEKDVVRINGWLTAQAQSGM